MTNRKDDQFDKRIIEKHMNLHMDSGINKEYEEYLNNLPDISDKTEYIKLPDYDQMPKKVSSGSNEFREDAA